MKTTLFSTKRKATCENIKLTRHTILKIANSVNLNIQLQNQMLLALVEALTNTVEHGNAQDFEVFFEKSIENWTIQINDNGSKFNPIEYHLDNPEEVFDYVFKENGRGIFLIKELSGSIQYHYDQNKQQNQLTLNWQRSLQQSEPRILIIDDDKTLLSICQAYCMEDYDVTTCNNAHQAIELTQKNTYDLILSDIKMPEMNGLELREKILSDTNYATVPFLFLTGLEDEFTIEKASYLSIDGIIKKPIDKSQLLNNLGRALSRSRHLTQVYTEKINRKITQALAPKIPKKAQQWRIEYATRNTGAGGGDLVIFNESKTGKSSYCVIADIMGHDETAKFFSFAFMGYLRGLINAGQDSSPENIINQINLAAYEDDLLEQTTLTLLAIELSDNGVLSISNAGHPQPLRINSDGITPLSESNMLPGLVDNTVYKSQHYTLNKKERIAVFTDGLFESANTPEQRSLLEQTILKTLQETIDKPIDRVVRQVMSEFDTISGTPAKDDVLLVLLEPT